MASDFHARWRPARSGPSSVTFERAGSPPHMSQFPPVPDGPAEDDGDGLELAPGDEDDCVDGAAVGFFESLLPAPALAARPGPARNWGGPVPRRGDVRIR